MRRLYIFLMMTLLGLPISAQQQQLTNLPTVYINTENSAAVTDKKIFVDATWILVDAGQTETIEGLKIRCRGNSTFSNAGATKKAYRLKFNNKVSLLGDKGVTDKNWVLMANHFDKSLIRNALTTDVMARFAGMPFRPGARFVDVVLNGEYIGNYQITDHPDVESGRLDITTPGTDDESEGFFLEADGWKDHKYVTTTRCSVPVRIHKPKDGEVTDAQADYVKTWLDNFETALFSKDFTDAEKGYRSLVDSVSLANLYLCTEMSANYDGFWSTYLYKRPNDKKMYFGPLWDYDIAYNNAPRGTHTTEKMIVDLNTGVCRSWFTRMWRDPWFRQLIQSRYNELRTAGIEERLLHAADSLGALNAQSAALNFNKYGINTKVYNEVVLHDTYAEYITDLKDFITAHFAYLDTEIPARVNATYDAAQEFELNNNYFYRVKSVKDGTLFDVTNEALTAGSETCLLAINESRRTQQWTIRQVGDAYQFLNRASGLALYAPNGNLDTRLTLAQPDENDEAQLWTIALANDEKSYYNIVNKAYNRTANASGSLAGALICWESNEKNFTSTGRQWIITPADFNSDEVWDVGDINEVLQQQIDNYSALLAAETPGTGGGQVSQTAYDELQSVINEAQGVKDAGTLNVNLMHSYIHYMERAWDAVDESRLPETVKAINFDAQGNYHLFQSVQGATQSTSSDDFTLNNDTPWGFYRYEVSDGTYTKFNKYDTNGKNGTAAERGVAWYLNSEYCFVSNTGHYHALAGSGQQASPAIVFTAPHDGIYYATITVWRDKSGKSNTLYLRSRCIDKGSDLQCDKTKYMFEKAYGTPAIDGSDGKVPQTLDFYINMKEGQHFTFETEAYTAGTDADGRTHIADLAVATCYSAGDPLTLEAAQAHPRFYDAVNAADVTQIDFDAEGNYHLFQTAEGDTYATAATVFSQNNDSPWGFYRYTPSNSTYTKFSTFDANNDKAKSANGKGWYTNKEYCFVTENGCIHPLASNGNQAFPAIAFKAPKDGLYFATMTVFRDKSGLSNPLSLRSRCLDSQFKCDQNNFMFETAYGTAAIDGIDGKVPQTLDFFVKLKKDQVFTFEVDASSDSGARSFIADLAVASGYDSEHPFGETEAQAFARYFDPEVAAVRADLLTAIDNASQTKQNYANYVGTRAFQIPAAARTELTNSITSAQTVYDNRFATADAVASATTAVNAAAAQFLQAERNTPSATQAYNLVLRCDGHRATGNALTLIPNVAQTEGHYDLKFLAPANKNLAQAFYFTHTTGNKFKVFAIGHDGANSFITTQAEGYASTDYDEIRTTPDADKAMEIEVRPATGGRYLLWNTGADKALGHNGVDNNDLFTANTAAFDLTETTKPSIVINTTAAGWGTTILPFAVTTLPEGVSAYKCSETDDNILTLAEVSALEANTPYILQGAWNETLTGDALGFALQNTEGLLTGVYEEGLVPEGKYVMQKKDTRIAFFFVESGQQPTIRANRAYLTAPVNGVKTFYFPGTNTAIQQVFTEMAKGHIFDLSGRRVQQMQPGSIYLINGQKVTVK